MSGDKTEALLALADRLEVRPRTVWRMQGPDGAYCMEWDPATVIDAEREARAYYDDQQRRFPKRTAEYEIKAVQFLSSRDQDRNEAAAFIRAAIAIQPAQPQTEEVKS